jgi:hypothetical protein
MSKRTKAIFAGTSNTMGLGMELELSKRFQDDEYLKNVKISHQWNMNQVMVMKHIQMKI